MIYLFKIFNELARTNHTDGQKALAFSINKLNQAWLIKDASLAKEILGKYEAHLLIASMVGFQQDTKQMSLELVGQFFKNSPYLLSGDSHSEMRKVFSKFYSKLENCPKINWRGNANRVLNQSFQVNQSIFHSCRIYVLNYILLMLEDHYGYQFSTIKVNDNFSFFDFYASKTQLANLQKFIHQLNEFCELQNDQNLIDEKWNIISLFVMGIDPLTSSIIFALNENMIHAETNDIFKQSSAISLLGTRFVTKNFQASGIEFKRNDEIFISPYILNQSSKQSHTFGIGTHTCLGKKLSLIIMDNFKSVYKDEIDSSSKLNYLRNFILTY